MTFNDFGFEQPLIEGLASTGFKNPTPIKEQAIPLIMDGNDLIACAQTGTGKTAAFLLPLINKIIIDPTEHVDTLIIVPTRELAIQIDEALQGLAYFTPVNSIAIYGGNSGISFEQEKKALVHGANVVIATPGRLISHLTMGYVQIKMLKHLVLDEADRMLDMGFNDDINRIITFLPAKRQTLMFSATMPPKIRSLAHKVLHNPKQINIALSKPAEGVIQGAYVVYEPQKKELLQTLLLGREIQSVLVFASTKESVKALEKELIRMQFNVASIHSDLEQEQRNEVLRRFKNRSLKILVATDVLSRGIDIDNIGLVINYDVPNDAEDYIHRVGRTARAETTGVAITFINTEQQYRFKKIEMLIGSEVRKLSAPAELGATPEYSPEKNTVKKNMSFKKRKNK